MQVSTNKSQANLQGIKPLSSRKLKRFLPTGYKNSTYLDVYPPNMEISRSRSSLSHSLQMQNRSHTTSLPVPFFITKRNYYPFFKLLKHLRRFRRKLIGQDSLSRYRYRIYTKNYLRRHPKMSTTPHECARFIFWHGIVARTELI